MNLRLRKSKRGGLTGAHEAEALVETGQVQFMVVIPSDFSHRLVRGAIFGLVQG
ncbi:hypothetical protein [Rhodoferax saidenbachensis]|uniref:Uncharacterized protein n=1 Tax=Rhodoferax saidenbachensis TaxID=1484693 RepID=A0ABU1ZGR6_9BURK|nr:hypothetical protein [Rhodoferax saidenbachensis]MDR7304740.1 hypothetical protein [Rhodoferax saidenbachensis]